MPYCGKCKIEYQKSEGEAVCDRCGAPLFDEPSDEAENYKEALLMTVARGIEAELIVSRLKSFGIPAMIKYKGAGGYVNIFMGSSNLGADIFVPETALELARELLDAKPEPSDWDEASDFGEEHIQSEKNSALVITLSIILPFIAIILFFILKNLGIL
ncbi:MAG: hypothetical protein BWY15_01544 [Firmicutes bacterium ADurb.Bin193]|nr:MAG: hypothetical protein BWY15_01544 [Firmicutes bacterium ADurb.Bin193]